MKRSLTAAAIALALVATSHAQTAIEPETGGETVDLLRYAQASSALAAMASALSILEPCDEGPFYSERPGDEGQELVITCIVDGEEAAVAIAFDEDLWPQEFIYLP